MSKAYESPNGSLEGNRAEEEATTGVSYATEALKILDGRWKMEILHHFFAKDVMRLSELERAIPAASQKMLVQQLRLLERDGLVTRKVYPEVPPKVEYQLSEVGRSLCSAMKPMIEWAELRRASVKKGEGLSEIG